jgi:hypothetical protein
MGSQGSPSHITTPFVLDDEGCDPLIGAEPSVLLERAEALLAKESAAWEARRVVHPLSPAA